MKLNLKMLLLVLIFSVVVGLMEIWFNTFIVGEYWKYSGLLSTLILGLFLPASSIYLTFLLIKRILK